MSKFHINGNGSIGRCNAGAGRCPFGGDSGIDNHYGSLTEAKQAYEAKMKDKNIPKITSKIANKTIGITDKIVIDRTVEGDLKKARALENARSEVYIKENAGSDYMLVKALINNPVAPPEVLKDVYDKSKDRVLKRELMEHNNFPVSAITVDEFTRTLTNDNKYERFKSDDITDEHARRMMINDKDINSDMYTPEHKAALKMLQNPDNKITGEFIKEFMSKRKISQIEYKLYIKPNVGVKI